MNPTTDSQALLTKTFLNFTFLFLFYFYFFVFSPVTCLCPTATPHHFSLFPIIMSNQCPTTGQQSIWLSLLTTIFTLSIYHSISFIYIMQGSKSHKHSHKSKNPKKKKKTQTVQFSRNTSTKSPNQFSNFSSSVKTQTRNTQTPQAQFLWFSESQITDSQGFEIWRKR